MLLKWLVTGHFLARLHHFEYSLGARAHTFVARAHTFVVLFPEEEKPIGAIHVVKQTGKLTLCCTCVPRASFSDGSFKKFLSWVDDTFCLVTHLGQITSLSNLHYFWLQLDVLRTVLEFVTQMLKVVLLSGPHIGCWPYVSEQSHGPYNGAETDRHWQCNTLDPHRGTGAQLWR